MRSALTEAGLIPVNETSRALLAISTDLAGGERAARVIEAARAAYRRILEGPGRSGAVEIGICVHAGPLYINESDAILPAGLMDARSWSLTGLRGVAASREALGEASTAGEPLPGSAGYRRIA